jgi:hypothetical protein
MNGMTGNHNVNALQARRAAANAIAAYVANTLGEQLERDMLVWLEHSGLPVDAGEAMTRPADWLPLVVQRMRLLSSIDVPTGLDDTDAGHYFGNCPICGSAGMGRDIGRWIFVACDAHQLCWDAGSVTGLLGDAYPEWSRDELSAAYAENRAALRGYRIIHASSEARYPRSLSDVRAFVQRLGAGEVKVEATRTECTDYVDLCSAREETDDIMASTWENDTTYEQLGLLTGPESEAMLLERLGLSLDELERFLAGDDCIGFRLLRSSHRDVVLKHNARMSSVPCAICGELATPRGGLDPFVRETRALVCVTCTCHFAPGVRKLIGRGWYDNDPVSQLLALDADPKCASPYDARDQEWTEADAARIIAQLSL